MSKKFQDIFPARGTQLRVPPWAVYAEEKVAQVPCPLNRDPIWEILARGTQSASAPSGISPRRGQGSASLRPPALDFASLPSFSLPVSLLHASLVPGVSLPYHPPLARFHPNVPPERTSHPFPRSGSRCAVVPHPVTVLAMICNAYIVRLFVICLSPLSFCGLNCEEIDPFGATISLSVDCLSYTICEMTGHRRCSNWEPSMAGRSGRTRHVPAGPSPGQHGSLHPFLGPGISWALFPRLGREFLRGQPR